MDVILIGFMGAGKTTISRLLAADLQLAQNDLDAMIVAAAGQTIPDIFACRGEAGFRDLETQTLRAALRHEGILATGGGTPVQAANFSVLQRATPPIVLLEATMQTVVNRIGCDPGRPLVQQLGVRGLQQLQAQRDQRYHELADFVVATDARTPRAIADTIESWLVEQHRKVAD